MTLSLVRALVFFVIGLPIGFIGTAFVFAVIQADLSAPAILPWATAIASGIGLIGGIRQKPEMPK